jgi:DNA primase
MISDSLKDEIKERCEIVEVVGSYIPLKRAGNAYKANCPFHNEKTPSFNVSPDRQAFYCFGCGKGGDVISFVMEIEGVDFIGGLRLLAQRHGIDIPEDGAGGDGKGPKLSRDRKDRLYQLHEKLAGWYAKNLRSEVGRDAMAYVRGRGLSDDVLVQFALGYAPESWDMTKNWGRQQGFSFEDMLTAGVLTVKNENAPASSAYDRFRNRLMFPIWNEQGRMVAFSGRALAAEEKGAKYVNSPETPIFEKSKILYGLHLARQGIKQHGAAVICEGQIDVIACHEAGQTNAVAPQGTAFTDRQALLLKRYTEKIVLAFDADKAGINAVMRSLDSFLPAGLSAKVVVLGDGEDPDGILRQQGAEALQNKIQQAQDFFGFLLDTEISRNDLTSPAGKAAVANTFLEAVAKVNNKVERAEYCQILASRLRVPQDYVFQELRGITYRQSRKSNTRRPEPESPSLADSVATAQEEPEAVLLELAYHNQQYAERLVRDLPPEYIISSSILGLLLNEVVADAAQGEEWDELRNFVEERAATLQLPELNKRLYSPTYALASEDKREQSYQDCLLQIRANTLNVEFQDLREQQIQAATEIEVKDLRQRIWDVKQKLKEVHSARDALRN